MNLLLIGLRGSGKSTIARLVASRLGRSFIELDDRTAATLGEAHAGDALRSHGQRSFREAEAAALAIALASSDAVVALGGGTPTAPGAAAMIQRARDEGLARVVYLVGTPSELALRLSHGDPRERPSLTGKGAIEEIDEIHRARDPLYRSLADRVVETGSGAPADHVEAVVDAANQLGCGAG